MTDLPPATEAVRHELFRMADTLNQRLLNRLADVAGQLSRRERRGVVGALDGIEAEIQELHLLMRLLDDSFNSQAQKGDMS
jgi:hypothetical protein